MQLPIFKLLSYNARFFVSSVQKFDLGLNCISGVIERDITFSLVAMVQFSPKSNFCTEDEKP